MAGLLDVLSDFPSKLKSVQDTLGMSDVKPAGARKKGDTGSNQSAGAKPTAKKKPAAKKSPPAVIVPLSREDANDIFAPRITGLVSDIKKFKLLDGDVKFIKVWVYYNADGLIDLFDVRFENETGKKAVITFYWDGKSMRMKGAPVLLYNRNLIAADADTPILIVEGAKTAVAAATIPGFIPVTWNGGGKKCSKVDWSVLKNRKVYIYPDDDMKCYADNHRTKAGELKPPHEQPGIEAALMIQKKLPQAKIITPLPAARDIKGDGADIVEALQVMSADDLAAYILSAPEINAPVPPSPIDTPRPEFTQEVFPFRILGVADDGKAYFLDRHERLASMPLGGITQNKLLTLAPLPFWQSNFATGKGGKLDRDDWIDATDTLIELAGKLDFDSDRIRGRGAWRESDGRTCYHDGMTTIGEVSQNRLYLRMTRKDIGIDTAPPDRSRLAAILDTVGQLSFETRADMIRCISWATLSPFAGALPWRPAGLLTGRSESGKSTIVDMIIKPLCLPLVVSGGESTEAGVRQAVNIDARGIVVEESETDTPKKRQRRDDVLSLMRQSTSDETPKAVKGTVDGKGMRFTLRSMFMFVAISPEVESIADDNRLFRVNLESKGHTAEQWFELVDKLKGGITPELCASVRALTWTRLNDIFAMVDRMSPIIQRVTGKSSRFSKAEALLFAAYQVIWKQHDLSDDELREFFDKIYDWQPPEQARDETDELLDKLLDNIIQEGRDRITLRQVLQRIGTTKDTEGFWKDVAGRYGLGLTPDGDLAMAKNFDAIGRIIDRGKGYQRIFWRHTDLNKKCRIVTIAGKNRNCLIIDKKVLAVDDKNEVNEGEPF